MEMNMNSIALAQQAKRQNESRLLRMNNVVAAGIGYKTTGGVRTDELAVITERLFSNGASRPDLYTSASLCGELLLGHRCMAEVGQGESN
jgi:hypothetical protein